MKIRSILLLTMATFLLYLPSHGQLDTLYFDDFIDDRNHWENTDPNGDKQYVANGFLNVETNTSRGTTTYFHFTKPLVNPDSFTYEVKLIPSDMVFGGMAYHFHFLKPRKNGSNRICCYHAMVADKKGLMGYLYEYSDARTSFWVKKLPELDRSAHTFRIEFKNGEVKCFHNGAWIASYTVRPNMKYNPWEKWGWLTQGPSRYKVDYVLLMGQKQE